MARCGCETPACSCVFENTDDFSWAGAGSVGDPYVLALETDRRLEIVCTSSTRPSHSDGRLIFETDTGLRYFSWNSQWYLNGEQCIADVTLSVAGLSIASGTLTVVENAQDLRVELYAKNAGAGTARDIAVQFNGDTGSNYVRQFLFGNDTSVSADAVAATTAYLVGTTTQTDWSDTTIRIPNYRGNQTKVGQGMSWDPRNLTSPLLIYTGFRWNSTAAITSVSATTTTDNFVVGTRLRVFARSSRG